MEDSTAVTPDQPDPAPTANAGDENKEGDPPTSDIIIDINEGNDAKEKNKDSNKEYEKEEDVEKENDAKEENKDSNKENEKEEDVEEEKETKKPLLDHDSVKIDMKPDGEGEDTPTLPLPDKKKKIDMEEEVEKEKLPIYLFPHTRIKEAWNTSTNIVQFLFTSVCIIFETVGWFTCVGGVPFISLAMLIIGSIYKDDCRIQPNIPIYLIVSGVIGTIQHVITIWTKYVPKNSQGRLKVYRSYCNVTNGLFHLFLMIWFLLGCIWVYSVSEIEFIDPQKEEYCHKTLYYFTFWILNLSFIFLGLVVVLSLCFLMFVVASPK